ncbi:uncharacterized protein [Hetaerina americana]|uniref:uncharacterized protein n=1 Tax=Hetaerina americana TaxID=62018 RepID=UPI003A7F1A0F
MEGREEDPHAIKSPLADVLKGVVLPKVPYTTFIFDNLRKNKKILGDRAVAVDIRRNQSLLFKDVEPMAIRFASALTKRGFEKGEVFFYITYNAALLYALHFGVWLCGGAVRGCFQEEDVAEVERQMKDSKSRFILCEPETSELAMMAASRLGWPVNYFSIDGDVNGASPVEEMALKDDGSAYKKDIPISPEEDILFIPCTNGSTGLPKGAKHTHYNLVAQGVSVGAPVDLEREDLQSETTLSIIGNFNVGPFLMIQISLMFGHTFISGSRFEKDIFFKMIEYHKPDTLVLFPYLANVISLSPELKNKNLSFIKKITLGGSVIDTSILGNLSKCFPNAIINTIYGMTETLLISSNGIGVHYKILRDPEKEALLKLKVLEMDKESHISCGPLLPLVEAKVVDVESGTSLERGSKGRILVRSPFIMAGYTTSGCNQDQNPLPVDEHGWFDTGDFGFISEDGQVYVIDRLKLIFKYLMHQVSPADIERVILRHPSVQSVGVVGLPNPETTSAAKAYIVIKPGCSATEEEIKKLVADSTPFYKHLHKGVVFTDKLPETRGGKLDRAALMKQAIREMKASP